MALWKAKSLTPEQKVRIAEQEAGGKELHILEDESFSKSQHVSEDESDTKGLQSEDNGSLFGFGDVGMSVIYSSVLSVPVSVFPSFIYLQLFQICIVYLCL